MTNKLYTVIVEVGFRHEPAWAIITIPNATTFDNVEQVKQYVQDLLNRDLEISEIQFIHSEEQEERLQ
jgi:hypothetical protein